MALQPCSECKAEISDKAASCPHCGAPVVVQEKPYVRSKTSTKEVVGGIALLVFGLIIWKSCSSDSHPSRPTTSVAAAIESPAAPVIQPVEAAPIDPQADMSVPQKNARRSAGQYLQFGSFSRKGLIRQLASNAGDGYSTEDATVAVDRLKVDWNEQAAGAAKNYLSFSGFSCKGLVQQLSSQAGDGFTSAQAQYGAKQAGVC